MHLKDPNKLSDEDLVRIYISSQDNRYFEELYERYSEKVYRKCYSFVSDGPKAEDLAHDIFLKVITKLGTFKENSRFSTWLYSITYNYCMDSIRRSKRLKEESMYEGFDFVEEEVDYEFQRMQSEGLRKSLEEIAPEEKAMLLMKYQDNFSVKEIAETFNISESATKMRLMRTKEKMKKLYLRHVALVGLIILKIFMLLKR